MLSDLGDPNFLEKFSIYWRIMDKLKEAEVFYEEMAEHLNNGDPDKFRYKLSAFLNATRSCLQYLYERAKWWAKPKSIPPIIIDRSMLAWYDTKVAESKTLKFFKHKRDINIHKAPIDPLHKQFVDLTPPTAHFRIGKTVYRAEFDDWDGPTADALSLCGVYLQELRDLITEAIEKRFVVNPADPPRFRYRY
jgi:hypothetical protein